MNQTTGLVVMLALFIPSITFHEFMHGYVAYRLGDPTAKNAGRLTMNPIKSIDPFGSILLPLIGYLASGMAFGYAKPVPYNPGYFKNLRLGEVLVGFAGPSANLVLASIGVGIAWLAVPLLPTNTTLAQALYLVGSDLAAVNLILMFFNLIPIPPLDGSSVVPLFLKDSQLRSWYQMQRYAFGIFIALLFGVPYISQMMGFSFNPIGWYLQHTAIAIMGLVLPQ